MIKKTWLITSQLSDEDAIWIDNFFEWEVKTYTQTVNVYGASGKYATKPSEIFVTTCEDEFATMFALRFAEKCRLVKIESDEEILYHAF